MHPTKKEVGFMHQDLVIDAICQQLKQTLITSMDSRTFAVARPMLTSQLQDTAPAPAAALGAGARNELEGVGDDDEAGEGEGGEDGEGEDERDVGRRLRRSSSSQKQQQLPFLRQNSSQSGGAAAAGAGAASQRPDKLVRADAKAQSITSFLVKRPAAAALAAVGGAGAATAGGGAAAAVPPRKRRATGPSAGGGKPVMGLDGSAGIGEEDEDGLGLGGWNLTNMREGEMVAAAAEAAAAAEEAETGVGDEGAVGLAAAARAARRGALPAMVTENVSALQLLQGVQQDCHPGLAQLFKEHIWVGMVSQGAC